MEEKKPGEVIKLNWPNGSAIQKLNPTYPNIGIQLTRGATRVGGQGLSDDPGPPSPGRNR